MSERAIIIVDSPTAPTVEVDSQACAAYIRFRRGKVAKTLPRHSDHCIIAIDLDKQGRVLGIEVIGADVIEIGKIMKLAAVRAPNVDFSRVRYVQSELAQPSAA